MKPILAALCLAIAVWSVGLPCEGRATVMVGCVWAKAAQ